MLKFARRRFRVKKYRLKNGTRSSVSWLITCSTVVASAQALSEVQPIKGNLIDFLAQLVDRAKHSAVVQSEALAAIEVSNDSVNHWYVVRSGYEAQLDKVLTASGDYRPLEAQTDVRDGYQAWRFVRTGKNSYRLENRWGENVNVTDGNLRTLYAHASSDLRVEWTTDGTHRFAILPDAAPKDKPALHCNGKLMLYGYKGNDGYYAGSLWTIEPMPTALVPEAKSEDYIRYIRRLTGFTQQELFGKPGQPVSATALEQAVSRLNDEAVPDMIYDLHGRIIDTAEMGKQGMPKIYICNGKKVIR